MAPSSWHRWKGHAPGTCQSSKPRQEGRAPAQEGRKAVSGGKTRRVLAVCGDCIITRPTWRSAVGSRGRAVGQQPTKSPTRRVVAAPPQADGRPDTPCSPITLLQAYE